MGILVGSSMAGIISATINLFILLLFSDIWKTKKYLFFFILFVLISSILPVWNYVNTGSFSPINIHLNKLLGIKADPDIFNQYLTDRLSLKFMSYKDVFFTEYLFFPFKFAFHHFNILACFFALGLFFLKDKKIQILYSYCIFNIIIYLFLVKKSVAIKYGYSRFHWEIMPVVVTLIIYVISKLSRRLVSTFKNFKTLNKSGKNISAFITNSIFFSILIVSFIISVYSMKSLFRHDEFNRKLLFIGRRINLKKHLGERYASIAMYFNDNFTERDKILFLFYEQGIYSKPSFYQPTKIGSASIIYRSRNKTTIMKKLKEIGINYLCVDNLFGSIGNNPYRSMVADITTPIFEPDYFSKHFIPIYSEISNFCMFKINYNGLEDTNDIKDNCEKIKKTEFYDLIYDSISRNIKKTTRIMSNPYSKDTLLIKYKDKYRYGICSPPTSE
jgi:hypothetical protein